MKITYLKRGDGGWYLRFSGPTDDWQYIKDWLKARSKGPYKNAWFVHEYKWSKTSKPGAWWVSHAVLNALDVMDVFENLDEMVEAANDAENSFDEEPAASSYRHTVREDVPARPTLPVTPQQAFDVLKLPMTTDKEQIKKAYHALAFAYHPDKGGDINQMKVVNVANDIILKWLVRAS